MRQIPVWLFAVVTFSLPVQAADEIDFQRDIRPRLSDRCFKCHGFDEEMQEADLGLHTFAAATRDLGNKYY